MTIKLHTIYKEFLNGSEKNLILNGISAEFKKGLSYGIKGRSGSGKSTLLHIIAGFEKPTKGELMVNKSINRPLFGFMFQLPYLINELSVLENIVINGHIKGLSPIKARKEALVLLDQLELIEKKDSIPAILSGGQQQRVAFARAIIGNPLFLIADEPTNNLDAKTAQLMIELFKEYKNKGMGLLICSHDPAVLTAMDTVLELQQGILMQEERK